MYSLPNDLLLKPGTASVASSLSSTRGLLTLEQNEINDVGLNDARGDGPRVDVASGRDDLDDLGGFAFTQRQLGPLDLPGQDAIRDACIHKLEELVVE